MASCQTDQQWQSDQFQYQFQYQWIHRRQNYNYLQKDDWRPKLWDCLPNGRWWANRRSKIRLHQSCGIQIELFATQECSNENEYELESQMRLAMRMPMNSRTRHIVGTKQTIRLLRKLKANWAKWKQAVTCDSHVSGVRRGPGTNYVIPPSGIPTTTTVMSSKNRKFRPPWPGRRSLSYRCLHKSELCWAEGRLTVGYPYPIISPGHGSVMRLKSQITW